MVVKNGRWQHVVAVLALGGVVAACGTDATDSPAVPSTTASNPAVISSNPPSSPPVSGASAPVSSASAPLIDHVRWVELPSGRSLQIYPTASGRNATGPDDSERAWKEVLALAPNAGSPGMKAQFDCHWTFARLVDPDKSSWNLEPWRPVVSESDMVATRCNPGGAEE